MDVRFIAHNKNPDNSNYIYAPPRKKEQETRTNNPDVAEVGCLHEGILAEPATKAQQHDTHGHQFIEKASAATRQTRRGGSSSLQSLVGPPIARDCTRDMVEAGRSDAISVGQRERGDE